jgi:hypothetical protein
MKQIRIGDITMRSQDFFPATPTVGLIKADRARFDSSEMTDRISDALYLSGTPDIGRPS